MSKIIYNIMLFVILFFILYILSKIFSYKKKEGYESLESCLKQGYPKSFCFQVPIQACLTNCD